MLTHEGDYPLYDVEINILDSTGTARLPLKKLYDEIIASHKKDDAMGRVRQRDLMAEMESLSLLAKKTIQIGTFPPHTAINLFRIPWPKSNTQEYFIRISTRSSYLNQIIKEKKIKGSWKCSWRVQRRGPKGESILLQESLSPEVPLPNN
jgi:hypothetical protein